jgi:hypothetical protein
LNGPTANTPTRPVDSYSRAFERYVNDGDDLVGLLAYALYKQGVREAAMAGQPVQPSAARNPTSTEITAYRGDAERRLQLFAASAVDEARPELLQDGVVLSIDKAKSDLLVAITQRTSMRAAVLASIIGWAITLGLTVLILVTIYLPNWQADLIERLRAIHWQQSAPSSEPAPGR